MAKRRMFSVDITESDAFLDMPLSSQALYFHLSMHGDDDGVVNNPKMIGRMIGASEDDIKLLIAKRFVIPFESGVVVVKHWRVNNYIQKDRYHPTTYSDELSQLTVKENGAYTRCIQGVSRLDTESSLGKSSLGKARSGKSTPPARDQGQPVDNLRSLWGMMSEEEQNKLIAMFEFGAIDSLVDELTSKNSGDLGGIRNAYRYVLSVANQRGLERNG